MRQNRKCPEQVSQSIHFVALVTPLPPNVHPYKNHYRVCEEKSRKAPEKPMPGKTSSMYAYTGCIHWMYTFFSENHYILWYKQYLKENRLFRQYLRPAQIIILKIRKVFMRLKF